MHKESRLPQKFSLELWASQRPMAPMMRSFVACVKLLHDVLLESEASLSKRLKQRLWMEH